MQQNNENKSDELKDEIRHQKEEIQGLENVLKREKEELKELEHELEEEKEVILIIEGKKKEWDKKTISFKEVIIEAYGVYHEEKNWVYTVAYEDGPKKNPEGSMVKGQEVFVKNKMIFHATATDKS